MSDKLSVEGRYAVLRDSKGEIVTRVIDKGSERENWRNIMRRLTNNGQNQIEKLADISEGKVFQVTLPDGQVSEPMIPTLQLQAVTSQIILEMLHGKATSQTEALKAEQETRAVERYRSLSDAELRAKVIEGLAERKALGTETSDKAVSDSGGTSVGDERLE